MPINAKSGLVFAKIQPANTYAESAAADWVEAMNLSLSPLEASEAELLLSGNTNMGASLKELYGKQVKVSFEVALAGSGSAGSAPYWGVLERICGNSQTAVAANAAAIPPVIAHTLYKPASTFESGSLAVYIGDNKHALQNAKGTAKITLSRNGWLVRRYEITGAYITPAAMTAPAVTLQPRVKPFLLQPGNTALSLHGISNLCLHALEISDGNEVKYMDFLNCAANTTISDRKFSGSIEFVAENITAGTNWWNIAENSTVGALSFSAGSAVGNKIEVTCPSVQLMAPSYGEADGIKTIKCNLNIIAHTAGDFQLRSY